MRILYAILILLTLSQNALALKPDRRYVGTPSDFGLAYDSVNVLTKDGFRLTAWLCRPAQSPAGSVIIAGGDAGNMSYSLNLASLLVSALQVEVLLFDYRGFGTSDLFAADTNMVAYPEYVEDVRASILWLSQRSPATPKILFGRSMGASLAIGVANDSLLSGIVAESPYTSQADLVSFANEKHKLSGSSRRVSLVPNAILDPITTIPLATTPIALIGGQREESNQAFDIRRLYSLIPAQTKRWLFIEGDAGHLEIAAKSPYGVAAIVNSLLVSDR